MAGHELSLRRLSLLKDPTRQLQLWLDEVFAAEVKNPTAMALATASAEAVPSCRMVLLKALDERGLVFYTNYHSRKAQELMENPRACVTLYWADLERQVTVEGVVEQTLRAESEEYFRRRPRGSQISAWASEHQGGLLESRDHLEAIFLELDERFKGKDVPLPPHWGGFLLRPHRFEFWQGRAHRLHDRFSYELTESGWEVTRLSP